MTAARTVYFEGTDRLDIYGMLTGYALFALAAGCFSIACHVIVRRNRTIAVLTEERDQALADGLELRTERDLARGQWAGWYERCMKAETDRDQGPRLVRRIRCAATAGKGAS